MLYLLVYLVFCAEQQNVRACACTLGGEIEEGGLISPVGQFDVGVAQLVKERVGACL